MTAREILFVCNNQIFLDCTQDCLEKKYKNYSIHITGTVKKTIKLLMKQTFDVIIADYNLPKNNGLEILTYLKENEIETSFILLIDQGKEEIAIEALSLGADYFIQKTSDLKYFTSILSSYIDNLIKKLVIKMNLEKAKRLAQHYLDIVDTIVVILDLNGNVSLINKIGCEILGYDLTEILGANWVSNFIPKRLQKDVLKTLKSIIKDESQNIVRYENPIINRNGEERIIAWHNQLLRDKEGRIYATLSNGEDITNKRIIEKKLKNTEEKYEHLFHNTNDAIFIYSITPEGNADKFIEINDYCSDITGYTREEFLKMNPLEIIHHEPNEVIHPLTEIILKKGKLTFTRPIKKKDGSLLTAEINAVVFNYDGQDVVLAIARDITSKLQINIELKVIATKLQERIKELTCLYQLTQYILPEGIPLSDYFEHILSIIPPAWFYSDITCARIFCNGEEYLSKDFIETKWKLSTNLMIYNKQVGKLEVYYKEERPQLDIGPFLKEEQDLLDALAWHIGVFISKKENEEELRKSKEYYQAVADSAFAGILIADLKENITYVNDSFARMLNYKPKQLLGLNLSNITTKEEYQKFELQTKTRRIIGKSDTYESILLRKDKTPVRVFFSVTPLKDKNGNTVESLGVVFDISPMKETEEKLLERQAELERQRDELNSFASTIAHDIRGKMQFISFYNSMVESEYSENIDDSIDEILQFIEDTLVLARTGEILSKKSNVHIVRLLEKITTKIHKLSPDITFNIGEIPKIYGDPIRLYQVFENLLMNVNKHANATQVDITSRLNKKTICISIKDNGKGMSDKRRQTIIDSWISRRYTSFGMLIVNKIMEAHKGKVTLESELGKGSTVKLHFPIT